MRRAWVIAGLVGSIGLNLFLLGAGLTFLLMRAHEHTPAAATPMSEAVQQLDPDHQQAFRRVLKQQGREVAPDLKAARAARRDAARLFAAPSFDRAGVLADLDQARQAEQRARTHIETAMVDFAQGLPADERAALAATVRRGLETDRRSLHAERRRLREEEVAQDAVAPDAADPGTPPAGDGQAVDHPTGPHPAARSH